MSVCKRFKKAFCITLLISFCSLFLLPSSVSAHEMYYDSSNNPISLVWHYRSNGDAYLKINGDNLTLSYYSSLYNSVYPLWDSSSSDVTIANTSFSNCTVSLASATQTYWKNRFKDNYEGIAGVTDLVSSDNYNVNSAYTASASSGRIKLASIYLTPYTSNFSSTSHAKAVMVHEIGHALCLGHPNTVYGHTTNDSSIMRQTPIYEGYYVPKTHDINDLHSKYYLTG